MITERLMKPGSFSVRLREDYPWSAGNAVDMLDHLVITPTRLDPISGFSDANILANAIYTGVITRKPSPRIFEGYGLAWWLGTPNGAGDLFEATSEQTQTMSAWVSAILAYSNGLTAGTLTNTGLSSLTGAPSWCTPREALDWVMRALGAEYRVNHDGTVDAAKSPDLFASASPTAVITRHEEGQDGDHRGLEGSLIVTAKDVDQYATSVVVVGQGAGATVVTESAVGSTSYKTFANGTPVLARFANAPSEASSPAASVAAAMLGQWNQVRRELSLTSRTHTVTRFVTPGDYVWVFDQLAELTDAANQIVYRGEVISPIKLRVYALTWPVQSGMGVYARRSGATPTYTDLTDFVEWETGEVVWDVGAAPRAANDTDAATAGGTAYLGANSSVAARASEKGSDASYAPTWTNTTLGNGSVTGGYRVVNGWCDFWTVFELGSTSAIASGGHSIGLPVTAAGVEQGHFVFTIKDTGNYYYPGVAATADASNVHLYLVDVAAGYGRGNNFAATAPFAFAAGDRLIVSGSYPVA